LLKIRSINYLIE